MLSEDFRDMLLALNEAEVRFLVVGAYAIAIHGSLPTTLEMGIWVMPSPENADAVLRALRRFGAPLHSLTKDDLLKDDTVFQIGAAPQRIDIITGASGLRFDEAFAHSIASSIDGVPVRVPSLDDLIRNKWASGRRKDLVDVEALEALRKARAAGNLP